MKKVLLLACLATLSLGACNRKSQCPAYSSTKDASRLSFPITASTESATTPRQ
ncbi:hypothetical protein HMJ29_00990 [Hymenobacter taeanensis]|uniref:Lipoprotein n=1 Tax=Hymenobacter taeanensis TaxID=2735321 RepID=A0A6M6BAW2_9BACT|nr:MULTISPECIES: hypothetical protein [Hymenobacter]QJX45396.1 hypothetical protein HMJ29_00990 [Hymenobacter taeanensis]UOQ81162.1 hypothetical protein MUN83_20535 [Hymenobacter sp. 5414T-23]